jgi:predicted CXXCH cytochrome family protein
VPVGRRAALLFVAALALACERPHETDADAALARYAGSDSCRGCHAPQYDAWAASLHAWAMRPARPSDAAATFAGAPVAWGAGGTARPLRRGGRLAIEIAPREGFAQHYDLAWFLGHRPIEQHLAAFPGGKLQALPLGFDTQRGEWFDLFADDPREPDDWGHWANRGMTGNAQCLPCHTTGYVKGYRIDSDTYESRWAEAGVGCEACHGARAAHVAARRAGQPDPPTRVPSARRLDACAPCHALRHERWTGFAPGEDFLEFFEPLLPDGDEYHPDGQLRLESYEWGSFLQSAMHRAGVGCSDCHDVHGAGLRAEGNALCLGCHDAALAAPAHTRHASGSRGSQCVECHMPTTVFMQRDPRRDHSFPLPDPKASTLLGVPNACAGCHEAEGPAWAAAHVEAWFGDGAKRLARRRLATAVAQARRHDPEAVEVLLDTLAGDERPVWAASAARLLAPFADAPGVRAALAAALEAPDALTRAGAAWALADAADRDPSAAEPLHPVAADPSRLVRLSAAWGLRRDRSPAVAPLLAEWRASMALLDDQPETHHTLGVFHADRGDAEAAEGAYRTALRLAPQSIPPRYNLAVLLAARGDREAAAVEFRHVRALDPSFGPAACRLGTLDVDGARWEEAVRGLQDCLRSDPLHPGALRDLARAYEAMGLEKVTDTVLEAALAYPGARGEALRALVAVTLGRGDRDAAARWAAEAEAADARVLGDP